MKLPILSLLTCAPLLGILFIAFIPKNDERNTRFVALWISTINFFIALGLWYQFDSYNPLYQFVEDYVWIETFDVHYRMGVDGISLYLILLSAFLTPLCILSSINVTKRTKEYMMAFLLMETFMIGSFSAIDLVLFYIFFEATLIPMFMIIGIWGGDRRVYATFKFFLYTMLGSVFMLIAITKIYVEIGTTDLVVLNKNVLRPHIQHWLWVAFFIAFAVKIPMWPFHTWLPDAHVEAPTAGSVLLAAILLKLGGYGMLRFMVPLLPQACNLFAPYIFGMSVIAIIYTSLIAFVQTDIKKLIAYSSIAHMGFVTIGIFTLNLQGMTGAIIQMISHGLISAGLFFCIGMIYERFHTREIESYGGLIKIMPQFAYIFLVFIFSSIGLPGTSGFLGEFLSLIGLFKVHSFFASVASIGIVLGAGYMLWLYKRICLGPINFKFNTIKHNIDLNKTEIFILSFIITCVIVIGVYPKPMTDIINRSVRLTLESEYEQKHKIYRSP